MVHVKLKHPKETFESLFRRFKKAVDKADVIKDFKKHEFFEKPTSKRKRAKAAAKKRTEKQHAQSGLPAKLPYR